MCVHACVCAHVCMPMCDCVCPLHPSRLGAEGSRVRGAEMKEIHTEEGRREKTKRGLSRHSTAVH